MTGRFTQRAALGLLVAAAVMVAPVANAATAASGKPSPHAACAPPPVPAATTAPGPAVAPTSIPDPTQQPDPSAGPSPSPNFPKPGTPGNCTPHAANLPAPQQPPAATKPGAGLGLPDVPGDIEQAIDTWIGDLAQAALTPIIGLFSDAMLIEPSLSTGRIAQLWQANVVLADSLYVLFVLAGGMLLMGYGTVQSRWTARQVLPRLVAGMIVSNVSLPVLQTAVDLTGALARALWNQPVDAAGLGNQVIATLLASIVLPDGATQVAFAVFALVVCVLALAVLASCAARIAGLMVLTVLAPLALATHALPGADGVARLWWRCTAAVLGTQILQTLVFMLMVQVICDKNANLVILPTGSGLTDFIVGTALLVIMLKIPGWLSRMAFGHTPRTLIGSILRTATVTAIGFKLGVPGAYSSQAITGRLVARRFGGVGSARSARGRFPRGPGGAASTAPTTQAAAAPPPDAAGSVAAGPAPGGLAPLGARGPKPRPGSHPSGQLALWRIPPGQPVPQPWWGLPPPEPARPTPRAEIPGQLQLPGFHRPAPPHSEPWPSAFRRAPLFPVPTNRRIPPPAASPPEPAPVRRAQPITGQGELFTARQARAVGAGKPQRPRRRPSPYTALTFQPPIFPIRDEEAT